MVMPEGGFKSLVTSHFAPLIPSYASLPPAFKLRGQWVQKVQRGGVARNKKAPRSFD